MLVDQKVEKLTKLLPCTFAMYDFMQLQDVSSVENEPYGYRNPISNFYQVLSPPSSII